MSSIQPKKIFVIENNTILKNVSLELMAACNVLKIKWLATLTTTQRQHYEKQVYIYNLLCENFSKNFDTWIWPTRGNSSVPVSFKKKLKALLGFTNNNNKISETTATIRMKDIGV